MSKSFIAYIRVSTPRQGEQGASLQEQRRVIGEYARKHDISIDLWLEELKSAKVGNRPVFDDLITRLLKPKNKSGLILHKLDRGVRSIRDWAEIGELIDKGIEIRFAVDEFDLGTRGGRLAADMQAVIAADYIRNLREEVKKGMSGRLHQGLYPWKAPRGYLDTGRGKVKKPDPSQAPLVVFAFKLYASGVHTLKTLSEEMALRGMVSAKGKPLTTGVLSKILHNPFYRGVIKSGGGTYMGIHEPLVSPELFNRVQELLRKRQPRRRQRHRFKYNHCLRCNKCQKHLIGEKQKRFVYYRCHDCKGVSVREDRVLLPDPRFSLVSESLPKETRQLEPWEKFESP